MPVSLGLSIMHLAINGGSCDTFPGFDHLVEWLTELRESLIYVYCFFCIIKDKMKGYRWTVKMNMYLGWGLEESQTQELLSPWSWAAPPPAHRCGHPAGSSQNPVPAGIVWRLQPTDMMDHYLNLPHLSPSWRMGCGAKSFKCLILSGDQPLTWSHPELPHQDKWHSSHPEVQRI